jgi:hypothetical protein
LETSAIVNSFAFWIRTHGFKTVTVWYDGHGGSSLGYCSWALPLQSVELGGAKLDQNRIPYPGGFIPGDQVDVVDGTFVGMTGRVVSLEEAGQTSVFSRPEGFVWVVVAIFGRPVTVPLQPFQIRRSGEAY